MESGGALVDDKRSEEDLTAALAAWREAEATRRGVPAYRILQDGTLHMLARARPRTTDALARVGGVGPRTVESYGPTLVGLIGEHCGPVPAPVDRRDLSPDSKALLAALQEWRGAEAERLGVAPYRVFFDETLRLIAQVRPATAASLRGIPGVGASKEPHIDAVLAVVAADTERRAGGPPPVGPPVARSAEEAALLAALTDWRAAEASARGLPPYRVLLDQTLRLIARLRPATPVALRNIVGVGPAKMREYGDELLALVQEHAG
ncbi:MAG TPA: HRDC domain-containing protein [Actinomycetota bacterium]|nr:HRDC domain-containing protein [Actinomycetota bacterium]